MYPRRGASAPSARACRVSVSKGRRRDSGATGCRTWAPAGRVPEPDAGSPSEATRASPRASRWSVAIRGLCGDASRSTRGGTYGSQASELAPGLLVAEAMTDRNGGRPMAYGTVRGSGPGTPRGDHIANGRCGARGDSISAARDSSGTSGRRLTPGPRRPGTCRGVSCAAEVEVIGAAPRGAAMCSSAGAAGSIRDATPDARCGAAWRPSTAAVTGAAGAAGSSNALGAEGCGVRGGIAPTTYRSVSGGMAPSKAVAAREDAVPWCSA